MDKRLIKMGKVLVTALLLFVLCIAAIDAYASVASARSDPSCAPRSSAQTCYTIDTSRPEWMPPRVFLPLVLRSY
jgi:tryptophan-rich sensory protein